VALLFLDTSALVKLYVQEAGTDRMLELAHPDSGHALTLLSVARIEFRAAVRRRERLGDIQSAAADEMLQSFSDHLAVLYQVQPTNDVVIEEAAGVIDRRRLRAYDALQLGGCLALRGAVGEDFDVQFVCADQSLLEAAQAEGFKAINPMDA
jgi:predicted nucleic acid-binding protein